MNDVLVVNTGSSSLKVKLWPAGHAVLVERIGDRATMSVGTGLPQAIEATNHGEAFEACLQALSAATDVATVVAVGHRMVHGGERYSGPARADAELTATVRRLAELAPLHNPANLEGLMAAQHRLPSLPHVAVFDTAFHTTLPAQAYLFGLPRHLYRDHGIRRYGFHGTSHDYVSRRVAELMAVSRETLKLVSLHLGNGASATAVSGGRSVDTSMGLTPLDGLLMGTRSGAVDPGVLLHLLRSGLSLDELDDMLNRGSGLLGLSEVSNDMRDVRRAADQGNTAAREAIAVFAYRVRKTIGAYAAAMGGLDGVVFTGGIGENDAMLRAESLQNLEFLGLEVDPDRNRAHGPRISADTSTVAAFVVPTDEEAMIARATLELLGLPQKKGGRMKTLGLDLGGTKIAAAVVEEGQILERCRVPTPRSGFTSVVDALGEAAATLLEAGHDVVAVGVGSPGPLDLKAGKVLFAPNIPGMEDAPIVAELERRVALPVFLENDANAAGFAEHLYGAAIDLESSVFITISTGIGGGLFLGDSIVRGAHGIAGEIGHMTLLPGGPLGGDGHNGSLEAIAAGRSIARDGSYGYNQPMETEEVFRRAQAGERKAVRIIANAARFTGIGIANLVKIFDPEGFVIGGGMSQAGSFYLDRIRAAAADYLEGYPEAQLRTARLGTDAGVIGAAAVAAKSVAAGR